MHDLTVCVTTYQRPERLAKCLASLKAAGIENVVVCDGEEYGGDLGCNNTWMVAAYRARTSRVILMHDDDELAPEFGEVYRTIIKPAMDDGKAGFVSWSAAHKHDDGKIVPCPYWEGPSTLMPAQNLLNVIGRAGGLSLSPTVSVLNRSILIRACKEANDKLTGGVSILRPGMTLGTEILVYLRHIQTFKRWLYLDKVLTYYGHHEGSGTVMAQRQNKEQVLVDGYDAAKVIGLAPKSEARPRLILTYSRFDPKDAETNLRNAAARASWDFQINSGELIECPYDCDGLPKIRDILDHVCAMALPEDIIVYANQDAGMTTHAPERLISGVSRGLGVTLCGNRSFHAGLHRSILQGKPMGGIDIIAMTPQWWRAHRDKMPDMFIGREAWDNCFQALAMEWTDGRASGDIMFSPSRWPESKAYTDDVCWHVEHVPAWQNERQSESSVWNRDLALAFFKERGNTKALECLK